MAVIPVLLVQFVVVFGNVISGGLLAGNNTSELKVLTATMAKRMKILIFALFLLFIFYSTVCTKHVLKWTVPLIVTAFWETSFFSNLI